MESLKDVEAQRLSFIMSSWYLWMMRINFQPSRNVITDMNSCGAQIGHCIRDLDLPTSGIMEDVLNIIEASQKGGS